MAVLLVRRFVSMLFLFVIASMLIFALLRLAPGSPADTLAGPDATPATIAAITHQLGLDQPLPLQYGKWFSGILRGDLGNSYIFNAPIGQLILQRLGNSVELLIAAMLLAIALGGTIGAMSVAPRGRLVGGLLAVVDTVSIAIPTFVTGVVLVYVLAVTLKVLPAGGATSVVSDPVSGLRSLVLPSVTLALPVSAVIARFLRASIRQVLDEEYVKAAVAKGLGPWRLLWRHVLPNALPSVLTVTGIQAGQVLGGAVVVEAIFAWPGLAQLTVQALLQRDYLLLQDVLLLAVGVFMVIQVLTDLATGVLDPRVRAAG